MSSILVILNPAASGGGGSRLQGPLEAALRERGQEYRLERSEAPGHASALAREALESGVGRILVVGGDGTVHEVANGLLRCGSQRTLPPLAILPVGTGNDFHRMVRTKAGVSGAVDLVLHGRVARFDVGLARWDGGERYFVNLLGVGVDVEVLRLRRSFRRLPGLLQYLAALGLALVRFRALDLRVEIASAEGAEEETIEGRSLLSAVTVGPSAGGGFLLSPGATPDDGLLDLCFVEAMGPLAIARNLPRVLRGTHGEARQVHLRRFRAARLSAADGGSFAFEVDGELVASETSSLEIRVQPGRLPVLLPDEDAGR